MKNYDIIAFDLDGTLSDPSHGLVEGYIYVFKKMGIEDYGDKNSLRRYIGPPIYDEWMREYSLSTAEADKMLALFREYYNIYGWWDNELYSGIPELLEKLRTAGKKIILATSKPVDVAHKILERFDLKKYFDFVGAAVDRTRDTKTAVLEYALTEVGCTDRSRAVMVGDRKYDAEGARDCGISSLGVLYGHGSEDEISAAGFTHIAKTVNEVEKILLEE